MSIGSVFGGDKKVVIDVKSLVEQINEKFEVEPVASYVPTANYRLVVKQEKGGYAELTLRPEKERPSPYLSDQRVNAEAVQAIMDEHYPKGLDYQAIIDIGDSDVGDGNIWSKFLEPFIVPVEQKEFLAELQNTKGVMDDYSVKGVSHSRETPQFIETDTVSCWLPVELKTGYLLQYNGRKPEQLRLSDGDNEATLSRGYHDKMAIPKESYGALAMVDPETKDVMVMDLSAGNQYFDMDELNGFVFDKTGDVTKKFVPHSERTTVLGTLGNMAKGLFSRDND